MPQWLNSTLTLADCSQLMHIHCPVSNDCSSTVFEEANRRWFITSTAGWPWQPWQPKMRARHHDIPVDGACTGVGKGNTDQHPRTSATWSWSREFGINSLSTAQNECMCPTRMYTKNQFKNLIEHEKWTLFMEKHFDARRIVIVSIILIYTYLYVLSAVISLIHIWAPSHHCFACTTPGTSKTHALYVTEHLYYLSFVWAWEYGGFRVVPEHRTEAGGYLTFSTIRQTAAQYLHLYKWNGHGRFLSFRIGYSWVNQGVAIIKVNGGWVPPGSSFIYLPF